MLCQKGEKETMAMIAIDDSRFKAAYDGRRMMAHGVTLVAFLGKSKPQPFVDVVSLAQKTVSSELAKHGLSRYFEPYRIGDIHATLTGLEGTRRGTAEIVNVNLSSRLANLVRKVGVPSMDPNGFLRFFREGYCSFEIDIGGFTKSHWNPFDPSNSPYDRGFDIQKNGLFVMMGWPVSLSPSGPAFLPFLCGLRKHLERFNVVHKYHVAPADEDNDLFFAIGSLKYPVWQKAPTQTKSKLKRVLERVRTDLRKVLSRVRPGTYSIPLDVDQLRIVKYSRTTLRTVSFSKPVAQVTTKELLSLY